jgi:hypothetical protein
MIEMSCEQHDAHAAATQFITHTTGRLLAELAPEPTPIDTRGYKVRKMPSWPRSWANFSPLQLYPHRNVWANLHLLGQPDTFLATRRCSTSCRRRPTTPSTSVRAARGRLSALSVYQRFPMKISFVWGFCMGAQGA